MDTEPSARELIDMNKVSIANTVATLVYASENVEPLESTAMLIVAGSLTAMLRTMIGTEEADRTILEQEVIVTALIEQMTDPEALSREVDAYLKML